jgi:LacI family transcriptional regulator
MLISLNGYNVKGCISEEMKKRPTIGDIARLAGVSDTTVSLAFAKKSRISDATRSHVLEIAKSLNYIPNRSARELRYGQSKTIGFLVTDITDPFYARMIRSAERISLDLGYNILFGEHFWDSEREIRIISNLIESRALGVIVCFSEKTREGLDLIRNTHLNLIAVDTFPDFYTGPYVANDLYAAGQMAAEHLTDVGCRYPIFFNGEASMASFSSFKSMLKGFKKALKSKSIPFNDSSIINAGFDIAGGMNGFQNLLSSGVKFDGIFCVNDLCAIGAMESADQEGLRIGEDVVVMGIDNLTVSGLSRISLTSIDQPYDTIIEVATRALIESIEKAEPCSIKKRLKPTLVVRRSTGSRYDSGKKLP